ncbi:MAG TPA: CDP-alcohol phosphatidyltransferase family protein [Ignavibacteriaceae bacterium]|nr:CDP-alcohol phosphatidyltransferase family protein [Ignavibacteriaceae bacterium]
MVKIKDLFTTKSNMLSLFRLLMAIPFWILLDNLNAPGNRAILLGMCILGAITDVLDGYLARKFNEVTEMGKIIDPIADKIVIGIIILKLYLVGEIPNSYFLMIILRDLLIFTGGIFVSRKLGRVLPSNMLGKLTVTSIAIVILFILAQVDKTSTIYIGFYYLSIIMIFTSLIGYTIRSLEFIKQKNNESLQKS